MRNEMDITAAAEKHIPHSAFRTPHSPSRREFLKASGLGFGSLALAGLLRDEAAAYDLNVRQPHFRPQARAIIQLFQNGGPSQMDLFDPKPELTRRNGQPHPGKVETFQLGNKNVLLASESVFKKHGQAGMDFGSPIPHIAGLADDICLVRSMHTEHNNHPFAINMM